jgi:anti-sigma B factor antagonist
MSFVIAPTSDPGSVLVRIGPGLDFRNAAEFKKVCREQVQVGAHNFVLDFTDTGILDSVGLGALFSLYRQVTPSSGQVLFASVSPQVKVMVQLTKIYRVFPQYPTVEEALENLRIHL